MRNMKRLMAFALAVMMFMSNTVSVSATGSTVPASMSGQNVITGTSEPGAVVPSSVESSTPEESTPEESTPEASMPEASTPEESTPEESTPEASTPEASMPEESTPEESTPEESTSAVETTEPTTEEATTEETTTEEVTTEEATTEEMPTAEALDDVAASAVLKVKNGDTEIFYLGLEDAVANIAKDFKSAKGSYTFTYTGSDTVTKDIRIPACVTDLTLKKEGTGTIELTLNATLTTSGKICLEGDWAMGDSAILKTGSLEVKKNGSLSAKEINLSNEESFVYGKLALRTLKLNRARMAIDDAGRLTSGSIEVTGAYTEDAKGNYTLCNRNELLANTINMSAGTFCNEGKAEVRTLSLKDMINQPNAQLICNSFTNTGKLTLEHDSIFLMNGESTIQNIVLGNVNPSQKNAALGKSTAAMVTLKGSFTADGEETALQAFVTNQYKNAIGTISTSASAFYTFETVALLEDGHDTDYLEKLAAETILFKTTITNFPVDRIHVLPNEYYSYEAAEGESAGWKKNANDSLYRDGEFLKITCKSIHVYTHNMGKDSPLKSFSNYKDAVAYINLLNNTSTSYVIEFDSNTDVSGKLDLPTMASEVILRSSDDEDQIILSYQGDIPLKTDTTFQNIAFMPYKDVKNKVVHESTVDAKGKKLVLSNVGVYAYALDTSDPDDLELGSFKAISGNNTTSLYLTDGSDISVSTKITNLHEIHLEDHSWLYVTGGVTGANELYLVNGSWLTVDGNMSINTVYTSEESTLWTNQIEVRGDKNVLEIKNCLHMDAKTYIDSVGTIKLKDVVSNCEKNAFSPEKPNSITITGRVTSDDTTTVTYVEGSKVDSVTGYRLPQLDDYVDSNTEKGFKTDVITAERMKNAIIIYCDRNVSFVDKLANAKMVSPTWFVINNTEWDKQYTYMTHKEGDYICADTKVESYIRLSVKNATGTKEINRLATLQEAFTEIDRLGDTGAEYVITIDASGQEATIDGNSYRKAVTALNKNETALADFAFPSKAKEVTICKSIVNPVDISYNKDIKLNCNVVFDNVVLKPGNKGNIAIGGYSLTMRNAGTTEGSDPVFGITGSGTNKGSQLIVESDYLAFTKIDQVDTVCLQVPVGATKGRKVVVNGDVRIGDLYASYNNNTFSASGKMAIENIYAPEGYGTTYQLTLETKPKYTTKNSEYTNVEPTLTISGEMAGKVAFAVKKADGSVLTETDTALNTLFGEKGKGLVIAKAPNAGTGDLYMHKNSDNDWVNGHLYKQSGNLVYKKTKPQVELTYQIGVKENDDPIYATEQCENYADAIAQINVLKTKRDYEILFLKNVTSRPANETSVNAPVTLTAPNAGCVDTLTLTAKDKNGNQADVYFKGDITFNSNIILKDIHFKQVITQGKENLTVDDGRVKNYANPVNVKVNGAYTMKAKGEVTFNNALALNGVNKATLLVDNNGKLKAPAGGTSSAGVDIEGTVKNFTLVKVNQDGTGVSPYLHVKPYATGNKTKPVYKAAELNVTDLTVKAGELSVYGNATVKNNLIADDCTVYVEGNTNVKDVSLSGTGSTKISSYGQTFNITGSLTSNTKSATIMTGLNAKKQSALNIAGDVILTKPENKIKIEVMKPNDFNTGEEYLGGTYTNTAGKTVTISNKLLTAKKADINAFVASANCLDPNHNAAYPGTDEATPKGYILRKSGSDINVHYAKDIEVALYKIIKVDDILYNYYTSFNEAVAAIDALNDSKQSYRIKVLQDVGGNVNGKIVYEKVNLPKKAASVTIDSSTKKGIYYNNDLTLGCETSFQSIGLYPAVANGKEKLINANGYKLFLINIFSEKIGGIKGNQKSVVSIWVKNGEKLEITGNVTDLKELRVNEDRYNDGVANLIIQGNLKVDQLRQCTTCELETRGSATITDYTMVKSEKDTGGNKAKWTYKDLIINGSITAPDGVTAAFTRSNVKPAGNSGKQVKPGEANRLLTVKKADIGKITFSNTGAHKALWANGAVYLVNADAASNAVAVNEGGSGTKKYADCLDLAQASAYVNARADRTEKYEFVLQSDITDTCVTDGNTVSELTLPAKDRMAYVVIKSSDTTLKKILFKGNPKINGSVTFNSIDLCNEKNFSISCVGNSDGSSILTFNQCAIGDTLATGKLVNFTGVKNSTRVQVTNTTLDMMGGITNVANLTINGSNVKTRAKSEVGTVNFDNPSVEWCALALTTIGSVTGAPATLGTIQNAKGVPQMTITGEVSSPVKIKLYDYNSKADTATEWSTYTTAKTYEDTPLVIANRASADRFMAYGCLNTTGNDLKTNIVAYKNTNNYVYNGDWSKMEVVLTDYSNSTTGVKTYAKTYADAITIINSMNNPKGEYEITLRDTIGNTETKGEDINSTVIKTALDKANAAYGAFALPQAGKAKSLTIKSANTSKPAIIKYTGSLKPLGKLELNLDNVILTEGKANSNEADGFKETNSVTLEIGDANVTLGDKVKTPFNHKRCEMIRESVPTDEWEFFLIDGDDDGVDGVNKVKGLEETCDIVFSKIIGRSGTLTMPDNSITFVTSEVSLAQLKSKETDLNVKGNIKIDHIVGMGGSGKNISLATPSAITLGDLKTAHVKVYATYNKSAWKKANTRFTVTGDADKDSKLTVFPYCYGTDGKGACRLLNAVEVRDLFWNDMTKNPAAYQKLLTAPKLSSARIDFMNVPGDELWTAVGIDKSDLHCATYNGSVYLTTKKPTIKVSADDSGYLNYFYFWEQAVKAIDQLNRPDVEYTIALQETIGDDEAPVKNLTLPLRAKKVTISAETMNQYGILMTGTSVNLRTDLTLLVPIAAVRNSRNAYYDTAYTMNVGKNELTIESMNSSRVGKHAPQFNLNGAAAGKATIKLYDNTTDMLTEIRSIGTVTLEKNSSGGQLANYSVANGITGVGNLILKEGVTVESSRDVNVKNLTINGESFEGVDLRGKLFAKNITVSDTLTMGSGYLRAGTSSMGDGKVTLNQVSVTNYQNTIEAKQARNGKNQIQITGTVNGAGPEAITIGLYYPNSITRYAQLYDGMVLLQAPKAADSYFVPYYATLKDVNGTPDKNDDEIVSLNMGREQGDVVTQRDAYGEPYSYSEWMPTYGTVKSGNDIIYCRICETERFSYDGKDYTGIKELCEVSLSIEGAHSAKMNFTTYEDAVRAIDRMGLKDADGKYLSYDIQLLKDVEIGNENGNHRYTTLPFPSKASTTRIRGYGMHSITFSGDITLRCGVDFNDVDLIPVKTVKNEVVSAQPNLVIGNQYASLYVRIRNYEDPGQHGSLGKVTGAAKGQFVVYGDTYLQIEDSISGMGKIFIISGSIANVQGNVTVKELRFENGCLKLGGTLTTDLIYQLGDTPAVIYHNADKPIVVKGANLTYVYASGNIIKVQDSVIRLYETGSVSDLSAEITVYTNDNVPMNVGSKVVTGSYLDPGDWVFMRDSSNPYTHYKSGNALYIGN